MLQSLHLADKTFHIFFVAGVFVFLFYLKSSNSGDILVLYSLNTEGTFGITNWMFERAQIWN